MKKLLNEKLISLAERLSSPLYLVGGCVRDFLIDKKISSDVDICSALTVGEVVERAKECDLVIVGEYKRTGTAILFDGKNKYEFTSFRKDIYSEGGGHTPDLTIRTTSILEDSLRRDFKCNAVYFDIKKGEFVDLLGGIEDIKNKVISTVKDAKEVFSHDGLRLMRLARLSAELNFNVDKKTLIGARENSDKIEDISKERILEELEKILSSDEKHSFSDKRGHYNGLKLLDEIGVLERILPELTLGKGMEQRKDFHNYDVFEHSLRSVLYAPKEIRFAMLLHDVGKPYAFLKNGKFHSHEVYGEEIAKKITSRLKLSKKKSEEIAFIVRNHMLDLKGDMRESKIRKFIVNNLPLIDELLMAKQADYSACKDDLSLALGVKKWREIIEKMKKEKVPFSKGELKINGKDLIKLGYKGEEIGKRLDKILELAVIGEVKNEREELLRILKTHKG